MPRIDTDSEAVRILMARYDLFDGAKPAVDGADDPGDPSVRDSAQEETDDRVTTDDLDAVVGNDGFTETERQAAQYLLDHPELLDALDVAQDGGDTDGRISRKDVIAFIDAHRDTLEPETVAVADARSVLETGSRDDWKPGDQTDDHDARLAAFARYMENAPGATAAERQTYRDALLEEVLRLDPPESKNDKGAPLYWLQRERLERLGPDGEGRISQEAYDVLDSFMPPLPSAIDDPAPDSLRTMTWNIGRGANNIWEPWADGGTQYEELDQIAQGIVDGRVDVAMLQEVFRGDAEIIAQYIEEKGGGHYEVRFDEAAFKWETEGGFGNAILVRTDGPHAISLDGEAFSEQLPGDGDEGRSVTGYELTVDGQAVTVLNTHLSSAGEDARRPQIERVLELAADVEGPVILAGDFNADPQEMEQIRTEDPDDGLTDTFGAIGEGPDRTGGLGYGSRIDYVWASGIEAGYVRVVDAGSSDHAGVVVDFRLGS